MLLVHRDRELLTHLGQLVHLPRHQTGLAQELSRGGQRPRPASLEEASCFAVARPFDVTATERATETR